jgi:hypothetical protein
MAAVAIYFSNFKLRKEKILGSGRKIGGVSSS